MAKSSRKSDKKTDADQSEADGHTLDQQTTDQQQEEPPSSEIAPVTDVEDMVAVPTPEETPSVRPRRGVSVLLGLVLGGVIAAGIGFYAARYLVPEGWPFPGVTPEPDPLALALEAQGTDLKALEARLSELAARVTTLESDQQLAELSSGLDAAKAQVATLSDAINALDARLLAVEKIPRGSGTEAAEAAAAAYERELAQLRAMFSEELARVEAAQQNAQTMGMTAEETARKAAARAAMSEISAALLSGQPFADSLSTIQDAAGLNADAALMAVAETGIPTLASLQDAFPDIARAALAASINAGIADGSIGRVEGFFRSQLGTRSLEPKEGDDPDAVLSRAEAALKAGQLEPALQELAALPEAGQAEFTDWIADVKKRLEAERAVSALASQVNGE
ncbi:MAG TPA: hypothetical protein ENK28_08660 [Aliiroseovarius sp.]|nr:hypothetical protein [Aliiroseovarius sp.]